MNPKKILIRALSGAVYIAIIVGQICLGPLGTLLLAEILAVMATLEFERISMGQYRMPPLQRALIVLAVVAMVCIPTPIALGSAATFLLCLFLLYLCELFGDAKRPLATIKTAAMAIVYVGLPMMTMTLTAMTLSGSSGSGSFADLSHCSYNVCFPILLMFILIWINDTGAFLVGSLIGRHKLFERISPKKTWEGFFGGMALTVAAAVAMQVCGLQDFFNFHFSTAVWGVLGVLVCLLATIGDLAESMIKRNLGLKDSGMIMPGHGGILDRIDSLLFVMPAFALFIFFIR